jgi:cell division protein FtsQ
MPLSAAAAAACLPLRRRLRRPPLRAVAGALLVVAALAAGWSWARDSSLVAVDRVVVVGVSGPEAARVRAALERAAQDMTTLHVREDQLRSAVAPFAIVRGLDVDPDAPHTLRIVVRQHVPVAAVQSAGRRFAVAADGTVLRGTRVDGLPAVASRSATGEHLDARTTRAVGLLAAAPAALRAKVRRLWIGDRGWTASLRDGPLVVFGRAERAGAKWLAATRVLADRSSAGATYVDVRLPERAAAGGLIDPAQQAVADAPPQSTEPEPTAPGTQPEPPAASPVVPPAIPSGG